MRISVSLPFPTGDAATVDVGGLVAVARAVEDAGLDACAVTDHPFPATEPGRAGHQTLDPFVLLGYLAAATERVRLHFNLIVVPYRNPFLTARMLATLDQVSDGRVIAALGAGYLRPEFDALGASFEERGRQVDEGADAMRAAWTGEPLTLDHPRYRAAGNVMRPVPVTRPHPPLWRGGNSRRAVTSAVERFDGWTPFEASESTSRDTTTAAIDLSTLEPQMAFLGQEVERTGRTAPLDVCLVRTRIRWLIDRASAIEDLHRMRDLGVSWVTTHVHGATTEAQVEGVRQLAEIAAAAGIR